MPPRNVNRSRAKALTRLVQTHVSETVGDALDRRASQQGLATAAYIRMVLMRDLGFVTIPKE